MLTGDGNTTADVVARELGIDEVIAEALLNGDLLGIVRARQVSQATMRNIRQNLFFAFVYNAAGIPIAGGVLYPLFGMLLSPIVAALAMALCSISVITNSLRLRTQRLGDGVSPLAPKKP